MLRDTTFLKKRRRGMAETGAKERLRRKEETAPQIILV